MDLNLPPGAKHPISWAVHHMRRRGIKIGDDMERGMIARWARYIENLDHENTATASRPIEDPPQGGEEARGFTTGDFGSTTDDGSDEDKPSFFRKKK
jgi:hypothetical protein